MKNTLKLDYEQFMANALSNLAKEQGLNLVPGTEEYLIKDRTVCEIPDAIVIEIEI